MRLPIESHEEKKSKAFRLLLSAACLAAALWTPMASLAISDCPPDYCGDLRDHCEDTGGQFTQTSISVCRLPNGTLQPSFNWICEYPDRPPTGDACYGV